MMLYSTLVEINAMNANVTIWRSQFLSEFPIQDVFQSIFQSRPFLLELGLHLQWCLHKDVKKLFTQGGHGTSAILQ